MARTWQDYSIMVAPGEVFDPQGPPDAWAPDREVTLYESEPEFPDSGLVEVEGQDLRP